MIAEHKDWYDRIEKHAREHYNEDGWDFFVETIDFEEFAERMRERPITNDGQPIITYEQAFEEFRWWCELMNDRRQDVKATAW